MTVEGPGEIAVGQEFDVTVRMATDIAISRLRGQVRFDSSALQLISATAGDVVPSSAGSPTVDAKSGGAQMDIVASDDPVQGEGSLMLLRFKALAARPASAIAAQVSAMAPSGTAMANAASQPLSRCHQAVMSQHAHTWIYAHRVGGHGGHHRRAHERGHAAGAARDRSANASLSCTNPCGYCARRIDAYKEAADSGHIKMELGDSGYPPNLQVLVDGVEDIQSEKKVMMYFLRRVPRDPLFPDTTRGAGRYVGTAQLQESAIRSAAGGRCVRCVYPGAGQGI